MFELLMYGSPCNISSFFSHSFFSVHSYNLCDRTNFRMNGHSHSHYSFLELWQNLSQNLNLVCICYLKWSNRIFCAIGFSMNIILSIAVHSIRFNIWLIWHQQHLFLSGTNRFLLPLYNILETTSHLQYKFLTNVLSNNEDAGKFLFKKIKTNPSEDKNGINYKFA